jgi:very-short-patch-repair endonuclease
MNAISEEYLRDAYEVKGKSTYEIALENNTYPNRIRRLLKKYRIRLKNKSEAQSSALKSGRHKHPTRGKKRSEDVKIKISESMARSWQMMSEQEKERRVSLAKQQWSNMTISEQESFRQLAADAVRQAAIHGSKLEQFLLRELKKNGYHVVFHPENILVREQLQIDLFLPELKVAIEVDGPAHFFPIWGEENLAKHLLSDNAKTGLVIQAGYVMIRIKHIAKSLSKIHERKLLAKVLYQLDSIKSKFPAEHERLVEIEVR